MLGLTEKDKEFIRQTIREELKEALTAFLVREITTERGPRDNGDLEKTIEKEEVNVLEFLVRYLPLIEGSNRGLQSDVNRANNNSQVMIDGIKNMVLALTQQGNMIESQNKNNKQINYEEN